MELKDVEQKNRLIWKTHAAVTKAEGGRKYTFVMSSGEVDRDRDVIDQAGIDLSQFKRNPVVLWAHSHYTPPIGRVPATWIRDGRLHGTVEFPPPGLSPLADQVEGLVREGFLSACSIGFSSVEHSWDEERRGINFKRIELYELSLCPVGSNREALREAAAKGIGVDALVDWAKSILIETQPYIPPAPPPENLGELKVRALGLEDLEAKLEALRQKLEGLAEAGSGLKTLRTLELPEGFELFAVEEDCFSIRPIKAPKPEPARPPAQILRADVVSATKNALRELVRDQVNQLAGRLDD